MKFPLEPFVLDDLIPGDIYTDDFGTWFIVAITEMKFYEFLLGNNDRTLFEHSISIFGRVELISRIG